MKQVWDVTMGKSFVGAFTRAFDWDFTDLSAILYTLQVILQPLWALYLTVPKAYISGPVHKYELIKHKTHEVSTYKTWFDAKGGPT